MPWLAAAVLLFFGVCASVSGVALLILAAGRFIIDLALLFGAAFPSLLVAFALGLGLAFAFFSEGGGPGAGSSSDKALIESRGMVSKPTITPA